MSRTGNISTLGIAAGALLWAAIVIAEALTIGATWLPAILSLGMLLLAPLGLGTTATGFGRPVPKWLVPGILAAAALSSASFMSGSGIAVILLVLPWVLAGLFLAGKALLELGSRRERNLVDWSFFIARFNLFLAGLWLLASRLGYSPLGFEEPIVLLTAVHFTFSGFGVATLTGVALHASQPHSRLPVKVMRGLTPFLLVLPYAVAIGFVISPLLKLCAAGLLAGAVLVFCGTQAAFAGQLSQMWARVLLRGSSACGFVAMMLVLPYALGDYLHANWLPIPFMIRTHGILNGPGFLLLALLGWSVEAGSQNQRR